MPNITHSTGPTLFRTYDTPKNKEHNCTIWQAVRATSAAPTLFKHIEIGPPGSAIGYIDAGVGFNNPVKKVIEEAMMVFGRDSPISCIVSIGAGQKGVTNYDKPDPFERVLPLNLIKALKVMATDTDRTAHEMSERYYTTGIYYRLNVDQGLDSVSLDEWKRLDAVRHHTKNYLKKTDVGAIVDKLLAALIDYPNTPYILGQIGT
jgi:hypothetical protein